MSDPICECDTACCCAIHGSAINRAAANAAPLHAHDEATEDRPQTPTFLMLLANLGVAYYRYYCARRTLREGGDVTAEDFVARLKEMEDALQAADRADPEQEISS